MIIASLRNYRPYTIKSMFGMTLQTSIAHMLLLHEHVPYKYQTVHWTSLFGGDFKVTHLTKDLVEILEATHSKKVKLVHASVGSTSKQAQK